MIDNNLIFCIKDKNLSLIAVYLLWRIHFSCGVPVAYVSSVAYFSGAKTGRGGFLVVSAANESKCPEGTYFVSTRIESF